MSIDNLLREFDNLSVEVKPLNSETEDKIKIIKLFNANVKGKTIDLNQYNKKHCGKEGYWLEKQFGIEHNNKNSPDINGYEMKKISNKITFGDFSATEYIFSGQFKRNYINFYNNWSSEIKLDRINFIRFFGNKNINKNNRFSWSGVCVPKYNLWNSNGQKLYINPNNDIIIYYSFSKDTRDIKYNFPYFLKKDDIVIAFWKAEMLRDRVNNKFFKKGFFICKKDNEKYNKICFGKPFNFDYFIKYIKLGEILFDSGMYEYNNRNYSHFRANRNFWEKLITEEY